jgi:phosphatidylglycerol---prolipoprotein diacylglyceryl transferase
LHPVLFRIPGLDWPLHTYGVLIVTGFLIAMFICHREAQRQGEMAEEVLDFAFWALLGGMIGARVVFILVNFKQYFVDQFWHPKYKIPSVLVVWEGGLVFYGAALGGFVAYWLYAKKRNLPMLKFADICVLGLPIAHVFGRLGCVAAGCCWGDAAYHLDAAGQVIADVPLAAYFPEGSLAYSSLLQHESAEVVARMREMRTTMPLVPVQLMESFGEAMVFLALLFVRSRKWFHGQVILTYFILYPILRSTLELFRGDVERGYVIPGVLSTSQFISLCVATAAIVAIFVMRRRGLASHASPVSA